MTKKEIRNLEMPKLNNETRLLAMQNTSSCPMVITVNKIRSYISINVFSKNEEGDVSLYFRYFIKKSDGILYNVQKNVITNGYLTNALDKLPWRYSICSTQKDKEKLQKWINQFGIYNKEDSTINCIIRNYEAYLSNYRKEQKMLKCEKEIDAVMKKVKNVPKSFDKSIIKSMEFSKYIFFDRKNNKGTCSSCGNSISLSDLPKFVEKEQGTCPFCNSTVKYMSEKRRKHIRCDKGMAVLLQAYDKEVLIARYFNIVYDHSKPIDGKPTLHTKEVIRTIIDYKTRKVTDYEWYHFNGKMRWSFPQKSMFCPEGIHHSFLPGELHKAGLTKQLKLASLETRFTNKEKVEKMHGRWYDNRTSCYKYIHYYEVVAENPAVEKFTKCGLLELASHFYRGLYSSRKNLIDKNASNLKEVLKLKNMKQVREAIECNVTYDDLWKIQLHNEVTNIERDVKTIIQLARIFRGREEEAYKMSNSMLRKLEKYIEENNIRAVDYFDYISNCKKLDYNMKSEIVLYPRHFKEAHDMAYSNVKEKDLAKTYEKIEKLLPEMHAKYDYECGDLFITAPNAGREITYEGQVMNHCVGGYVSNVAEGKTVILFLRKKEEPQKPFITMEVKDNTIIQVRGFGNQEPPENVKLFVDKYKEVKELAA